MKSTRGISSSKSVFLGEEFLQQALDWIQTFCLRFSPIWWNNIIKAVCMGSMLNRCSSWHKGWLSPKEMEAVLYVISLYIEDFLTVIQAWRCWYVTGGLADFVSLPIIGHCVIKGHQCQGRCLGLPGLAFATCIYELPFISWSSDESRIALSYVKTTVNTAGFPPTERKEQHISSLQIL